MSSQTPTNLNKPDPGQSWIDKATGALTAAVAGWFAALAGVLGDWDVGGALSAASAAFTGAVTAASATLTGLLMAGSAIFSTAGSAPFNGKLFAGDAGWTAVSAFTNGWATVALTQFRRLPDGMVSLIVNVSHAGASGAAAFTLPAGYRPAQQILRAVYDTTGGNLEACIINTNGTVQPCARGLGQSIQDEFTFYAGA